MLGFSPGYPDLQLTVLLQMHHFLIYTNYMYACRGNIIIEKLYNIIKYVIQCACTHILQQYHVKSSLAVSK